MGWNLIKEKTFNSWYPYKGEYDILTTEFWGPPEQVLPVSWAVWFIEKYMDIWKLKGEELMYIRVDACWEPTFRTDYKVTTYSHGNPFPATAIIGLISTAIIVVGLTLTTWFVTTAIKTVAETAPLTLILLAGAFLAGIVLLYMITKKPKQLKEGKLK